MENDIIQDFFDFCSNIKAQENGFVCNEKALEILQKYDKNVSQIRSEKTDKFIKSIIEIAGNVGQKISKTLVQEMTMKLDGMKDFDKIKTLKILFPYVYYFYKNGS